MERISTVNVSLAAATSKTVGRANAAYTPDYIVPDSAVHIGINVKSGSCYNVNVGDSNTTASGLGNLTASETGTQYELGTAARGIIIGSDVATVLTLSYYTD